MENEIQFLLYSMPNEQGKVQVIVKDGTIWCTQKAMAQLFGVEVNTINYHLKEIYSTKELTEEATIRKIRIVQKEGNRNVEREQAFYSLDAIISVGYRVNSIKATKFRQWATLVLKEYITKGFALDDERLKQGAAVFGKDYFRELLERVRFIRASVSVKDALAGICRQGCRQLSANLSTIVSKFVDNCQQPERKSCPRLTLPMELWA